MNKYDEKYIKYILSTLTDIDGIYTEIVKELGLTISASSISAKDRFFFKNNVSINKQADRLIREATEKIISRISVGISFVWGISDTKNDVLVKETLQNRVTKIPTSYTARNVEALESFQKQKIKGFTISDRVWNYNGTFKNELEKAIDVALTEGKSAVELSRSIKKYLNNPDALFRRVRDKHGDLKLSKPALEYHPGQGVYWSAAQNAMRLLRDVINEAYRYSDWLRWQELPFVYAYQIKPSNRKHTVCQICEELQGIYPKSFLFKKWHIQGMCSCIPILVPSKDLDKIIDEIEPKQPPLPKNFTSWFKKNKRQPK